VHAESCILAPNGTLNEIRKWLRDSHGATDIELLHDVADAFKHAKLTRRPGNRDYLVQTDRAVVSLSTGYGRLGFGEGKFGGGEQVIICQADGTERALSSVLFNVRDAWRQAIALPLLGNVPK
jgi:hypothetical protein